MPDVHVVFVTGRAARDGRQLTDVSPSWVIGNHGIEVSDPRDTLHVDPSVAPHVSRVAGALSYLEDHVGRIDGVIVEDKHWTLSVHYRLVDRAMLPAVRDAVMAAAHEWRLRITEGKKLFELRPAVEINKGTAVTALAAQLGVTSGARGSGIVFYAGDDRTDEDAFVLLRERTLNAVTVHVGRALSDGGSPTAAELRVEDPAQLRELLEWVAQIREKAA